jgi:oxygen-dependent protoporphyrinogen oxidase
MSRALRIAVVGGGISGVAAAVRCVELAGERGRPVELRLYEASNRLGGVISTHRRESCLLEGGPDALFTEKPWGLDFAKKVGLSSRTISTNPEFRSSFIALRDRLLPVPEGFYLLAPSKIWPLAASPIFSPAAKLRMLLDLVLPSRSNAPDESLASFVRRRLGREALERMAQPMVAGIYSADAEELSLEATFPQFRQWEKKYGSVIRGMWLARQARKTAPERGPRYSLFVSFEGGMESLIECAARCLPPESIRLETEIRSIRREGEVFRLSGPGIDAEADAVCLALPAFRSAGLLESLDGPCAKLLRDIPYHSGATVNLIYNEADVPYALEGFGFVVPAIEEKSISGCTFSSVKFLGRAPRNRVVLRAFIGGRRAEELLKRSDAEVAERAGAEVKKILNLSGAPLFVSVHRYESALPQYLVGHLDKIGQIEDRVAGMSGVALAGNGYRGVGIPDCIRSGEKAAEKLFNDAALKSR